MEQEIYKSLHTHLGIITFDEQLRISFINEKAASLLRLAPSIVGSPLRSPDMPSCIAGRSTDFFRQILDGKDMWETAKEAEPGNLAFHLHFFPLVQEEAKEKQGLITFTRISTDRDLDKKDDKALLEKFVDYSPTHYSIVDIDGNIHFHDQSDQDGNKGKRTHLRDILPDAHYEQYLRNIRLAHGNKKAVVAKAPDPNRPEKNLLLHHFPIHHDPDKPLVGIIATDISEIQEKEGRIRQINQLLEKLIKLSEQLFSARSSSAPLTHLVDILSLLCKISSAESVFLFRNEYKKEGFQLISRYDTPTPNLPLPQLDATRQKVLIGWLGTRLWQHPSQYISDPDMLPNDASQEKQMLKDAGVVSFLATRLSIRGEATGYLCFTNLNEKPEALGHIIQTVEIASYQLSIFFKNYQLTRQMDSNRLRYELLARNITDVVSLQSLSGRCLTVSPSVEKMLGYTPKELIGRVWTTHIHTTDLEGYLLAYNALKQGETMLYRHRMTHKDGSNFWVESSGKLIREEEDSYLLIVTRNVEKQVKAEEEIKQREEYFKSLIRSQSSYLIRTDLEGNFTFYNRRFRVKFQFGKDLIGESFIPTIHPDDVDKCMEMAAYCIEHPDEIYPIVLRKPTPDGDYFSTDWEFTGIPGSDGQVIEIQGVGNDITEKQRALKKVEENEAFMRSLINNNSNPIWAVDQHDQLLYANEVFLSMTSRFMGIQFQIGDPILEMIPKAEQLRWRNYYERARVEGNFKDQQKFTYKGRTFFFDVYFSTIYNENGLNIGHAVFAANISELKATELALLSAKKSLEEAIQTRTTFLSMITHELRTPLNAILGMSDLIRHTKLDEKQSRFVETLTYSGKMLSSLINDILDYTSIQAGEFKMEIAPFNLIQVVEQTVNLYRTQAKEKEVKLTYDYDKQLPTRIQGDSIRLGQILNNLIENALKHTQQGEVHLSITPDMAKESGEWLCIVVSDTGIGIPADKKHEIFEPFRQVNHQAIPYQGGRGLGLAIVKQLAEHDGGSIEVDSEEGKGSSFTIHLPYKKAYPSDEINEEAFISNDQRLSDLRVLYIEDMTINQTLMKGLFQNWGSHLDVASDGYQGVDMVTQNEYDLILLDLFMPKLDGYATARRIRALPKASVKDVPIIAVSAFQGREIQSRIIEAGINDYVSKPVDFQKLLSLVLKYTRRQMQVSDEPEVPQDNTYLGRLEKFAFKDREQYERFIKNLRNEFSNSRERLKEAVISGDNEAVSFVRHHSHAMLSMFSGEHSQLLERLNHLRVEKPNDPEALRLLDEISQEFKILEHSIDQKLKDKNKKI